MIDSFHYLDNSSLFHMELIGLWVSERIGLPTSLNNSTSILSVHVICAFLPFQKQSQSRRLSVKALAAMLYAFLPA